MDGNKVGVVIEALPVVLSKAMTGLAHTVVKTVVVNSQWAPLVAVLLLMIPILRPSVMLACA